MRGSGKDEKGRVREKGNTRGKREWKGREREVREKGYMRGKRVYKGREREVREKGNTRSKREWKWRERGGKGGAPDGGAHVAVYKSRQSERRPGREFKDWQA